MRFNHLYLKNIRSFENISLTFQKSNFITGWNKDTQDGNGVGKSTIILGVLLLLGGAGFANINLKKLIRSGCKEAMVKGVIETDQGNLLEIERTLKMTGTGKLSVTVNKENPELKTSRDYQNLIWEHLGNPDNFKKLRILDKAIGVNILDFSSGQLRKTLMQMCQDKFEIIRNKLLEKKREFEKYNRSSVLSSHAPSENRLQILEMALAEIDQEQLAGLRKKISSFQQDRSKLLSAKGKYNYSVDACNKSIIRLKNLSKCPQCLQMVPDSHKAPICESLNIEMQKAQTQLTEILKELKIYDDIIQCEDKKQTIILRSKDKINKLKYKLETRIQQKDYKYTNQDIELAKNALAEIDNFANYYIIEWISIIEPIVNAYIAQLSMKLHFDVDEKSNINIQITRGNETLEYEQLSNGEQLFVSFIFKIALLLEHNETGLMIADEAFDCLSVENLNRITKLVSDLPIQLIWVSHNRDVDLLYARLINLEKENGISKLKTEEQE